MNKVNIVLGLKKPVTKKLLLILPLVFLLLTSCALSGKVFNDKNVEKLKPGMTEQQVIEILGVKPSARSKLPDGNYLLQWIYSYATGIGVSGTRHIAIKFSSEGKMVEITHQYQSGPGL